MDEILEVLEKNNRYTNEQIGVMIGKTAEGVKEAIKKYEEDKDKGTYFKEKPVDERKDIFI